MAKQRGNGSGNISRVKGKKNKPYRVRITVECRYDEEKEKVVQKLKTLGYYQTKREAEEALVAYNSSPYDLSSKVKTFADLYDEWSQNYFKDLKDSSIRTVVSAYRYCSGLYHMEINSINVGHLKDCMECGYIIAESGKDKGQKRYASPCIKQRMKSMFNLMFDYAESHNLVQFNRARQFKISDSINKEIKKNRKEKNPFTRKEIDILWKNVDNMEVFPFVDMILIGIYTGFRPSELASLKVENVFLDENKLIGGMKTEEGTDREVPVHPRIKRLIEKRYRQATEVFSGVNGYLMI